MSKIAVIGSGYVGLTSAIGFAHVGHDVLVFDIDADRIRRLKDGERVFHEPGLWDLEVQGSLRYTADRSVYVSQLELCDFALVCVGTPRAAGGGADLSAVDAVVDDMLNEVTRSDMVIAIKSTVPPGTCDRLQRTAMVRGQRTWQVVSNPEFLREGCAVHDFLCPDRTVIGGDRDAVDTVATAYRALEEFDDMVGPIRRFDATVDAELAKYASNVMLAARLCMVNELATVCEDWCADVENVLAAAGDDDRIGHQYMRPGPGWGGSCFPKDVDALAFASPHAPLIGTLWKSNQYAFSRAVAKVKQAIGWTLANNETLVSVGGALASGLRVAVWGLAFKADTDDVRDSPAIDLVGALCDSMPEGPIERMSVWDPSHGARAAAKSRLAHITDRGVNLVFSDTARDAVDGADALVIATEWQELATLLRMGSIIRSMRGSVLVDLRNIVNPGVARRLGFQYHGLGRRPA